MLRTAARLNEKALLAAGHSLREGATWDEVENVFMAELARVGLAVIMVSSELPEVLGMADRIIVMREGRMAGEFARSEATPEKLVRAAAGIVEQAA